MKNGFLLINVRNGFIYKNPLASIAANSVPSVDVTPLQVLFEVLYIFSEKLSNGLIKIAIKILKFLKEVIL